MQNFDFLIWLDMLEPMLVYYFYKRPESSSSCLKDSSRRQNLFFMLKLKFWFQKKYAYRPFNNLKNAKDPASSWALGKLQVASWNLTIISYLVLDIYKRPL